METPYFAQTSSLSSMQWRVCVIVTIKHFPARNSPANPMDRHPPQQWSLLHVPRTIHGKIYLWHAAWTRAQFAITESSAVPMKVVSLTLRAGARTTFLSASNAQWCVNRHAPIVNRHQTRHALLTQDMSVNMILECARVETLQKRRGAAHAIISMRHLFALINAIQLIPFPVPRQVR